MSLLQTLAKRLGPARFLRFMRLYPPYLGAGITVTHVADDLTSLEVEMKLLPFNRNFFGTQFGGSLYSMVDPFYVLLIATRLGPGFHVWDKSAQIDFLKPGRGTVRARFELSEARFQELKASLEAEGKINPAFTIDVTGPDGEVVARVTKVLSIRRAK